MAISKLISRAATATPGVIVDDDGVRWCGPIAPEAPSALVELRLARSAPAGEAFAAAVAAADPIAIGAVARELPMPTPLADALAARCLEAHREESLAVASGKRDADARWAAALARVARARGLGSTGAAIDAAPEVVLTAPAGRQLTHVRELPDGGVAVLEAPDDDATSGAQLWLLGPDGARTSLSFAGAPKSYFALPTPVRADPSLVVVTAYLEEPRVATAWLVRGGRVERCWRARVESQPQEFSTCDAGLWLHCEAQHALLDAACVLDSGGSGGEPPEPKTACARGSDGMYGKLQTLGSWLPVFSRPVLQEGRGWVSERLSWIDLDGRHERVRLPWDRKHIRLVITADAIYATADDGLWRLLPGAAPERLSERPTFDVLVEPDTIWACSGSKLMRFERATGRLLVEVEAGGYDLVRLGAQIVTVGGIEAGWSRFDEAGHLLERADKGRDPAYARLADGTVALSAGAQVTVLAADGTLRRRMQLPYDGMLVGATATHFIYGPTDGGVERERPDALYAIDGEGNLCSRATPARRPTRIFFGGGSTRDSGRISPLAVWLMPYRQPLRRWTPGAAVAAGPPLPERNRRVERGARTVGFDTVNPRDDWPEPGRQVIAEDFLAIDGTYGGTTGVSRGPAVQAEDRSTATLVGCTLVNGGWLRVQSSSTILLFGCTIRADPAEVWETEPRCHLVLVDCRFEGEARIRLDADSHLSIDVGAAPDSWDGCVHLGAAAPASAPAPIVEEPPAPVVAAPPEDLESLLARAQASLRPPLWQEARALADRALALAPNDSRAAFVKGVASSALGELDDGISWLQRSLLAAPDNHDAWYNLGLALQQRGQLTEALASFDCALSFDAANHPAFFQRGVVLEALGRRDEALAAYRDAVRTSPNPGGVWGYSGMDLTERAQAAIERLTGRD